MGVLWGAGRGGRGGAARFLGGAPGGGRRRTAVAGCAVPAGPYPDALLLVATYRYRRETCGQAYCTAAGRVTVARLVSAAPATSMSYCVRPAPTSPQRATFPPSASPNPPPPPPLLPPPP